MSDVNEVCRLLKPAKEKWYPIGVLLKVPTDKLFALNSRCKTDDQRLFTMVQAWLQQKKMSTTYTQLTKVLRNKHVREKTLAAEIAKEKERKHDTKDDIIRKFQTAKKSTEVKTVSSASPRAVAKKQPLPDPTLEKYLRAYYAKGSEARKDDWPPNFHNEYVNLVLVPQKKMPLAKSRAEEKIKLSVLGNIKRIAAGQRLGLSDILTSESDRVTIVNGGPGAGKTTLAKKLRREWANRQLFSDTRLALYVPLREPMARLSESIDDLLSHFGENCNEGDRALIKANEGAGILFILDGWDELRLSCRGEQQFFPKLISGQILPGSKVIVLSRPGASIDILCHADQVIEVLGFTGEQVKDYIHNYYCEDKAGASKLIADLDNYPNIASTCYVPINLAIVCHVYNALNFDLPPTITEVYQWFIIHTVLRYLKRKETMEDLKVDLPLIDDPKDFFVSTTFNDSVKKSFNDSIIESLMYLGELAIDGLQNDDLCFSRKQLISTCKLDEQNVQFDGFGLLKPVQISFVTRAEPFYHFLHLSIQEFIAGFYVSQVNEAKQKELLTKIDHDRYGSVFKHFCGLDKFQSSPLRKLFERKEQIELFHLESIHEGQWHDFCKEIAKKCSNTLRFEQNLQPHQWEVLSYIMLKSGVQWRLECSMQLIDVNGMACFSRHLFENGHVLHQLCFKRVRIDQQAYVQVAKICQLQAGLTEIEFNRCSLTDDGVFTIFEALELHPSLKCLRVLDDSLSSVVSDGFVKLLPTLPSIQCLDVCIKNFRDRDYLDITRCAKKCNPSPIITTLMQKSPESHVRSSHGFAIDNDTSDSLPTITLEELVEYVGIEKKLLDMRCQDAHIGSIASLLAKCDSVNIPLLKLTKADFYSSEKEVKILQGLQAWKKRLGFKAKYKCLVEELLACGNAELAEEVCNHLSELSTLSKASSIPPVEKDSSRTDESIETKEANVPVKRTLDSKPKLHELDRLEGDNKVLHIIKTAASNWETIATRLHFEGFSISAIERDTSNSVIGACRRVFTHWLAGVEELREPRTWSTVIRVLKEAELSELALKVEDILTHS